MSARCGPAASASTSPDASRSAAALYDAMQELVRIYQFRDRDRACYGRVTPNECYALEAVERAGALSVGELAAALGLHKSNASRIADALVAKRYVSRRADPRDGRGRRLTVTARGAAAHAAIRAGVEERYAELLARFPAEQHGVLVELIRVLGAEAAVRVGGGCDAERRGPNANEERSCS
jgi:MarR family 2-MHQ and catechol resistance regulon transcriptional repressor